MGSGTGFGMTLKRKSRRITQRDTLNGLIEQRAVRHRNALRQGIGIDCKPVILTGDHDLTGRQIHNGMVCAVMTELHLECSCARCESKQLVSKADAKYRHLGLENLLNCLNRIGAWLRIPRPIR